jgi:hypothetical protein
MDALGRRGRLACEATQASSAPLFPSTAVAALRGRGSGIRSASVRTSVQEVGTRADTITARELWAAAPV